MTSFLPRTRAVLASLLLAVLVLAACGGGTASQSAPSSAAPSTGASSPVAPSPSPSEDSQPTPREQMAPTTVRLALDWTPNTNHTGFYVAQAKRWYADAAVALDVLPYGGTAPEAVLSAGQADCGISFQDSLTFAVAAGAPIRSVMAILQHTAQEVAVLESSDITRPRELDGAVYAGFGYPNEVPTLQAVIREDGGKGEFDVVTLDTAAYEALYQGRADFVITFSAWEGIQAGQRGIALRTFQFTDHGFPDFYQVVLACNTDWLAANEDAARRFLAETVRGFELAASSPDEAATILVQENPGVFDANTELPLASARFMSEQGLLVDAGGNVGVQTLEQWTGYSSFLYEQGLLADADGRPLAAAPDYAALFTNDYLPQP